ncbi:hypothetical protein [Novosphingobium beihaiensis]|uniref:Annexin n=1 Tax=Novosphingobium beihaiensis TaxID=2930389 RepID=A0ABT0BN76_9SPHN|nr:hypothetical protein [Novosphingobium beihaiensis]MCJ2186507.1 hypothetical protein [Novosphingobium beihaiensis]
MPARRVAPEPQPVHRRRPSRPAPARHDAISETGGGARASAYTSLVRQPPEHEAAREEIPRLDALPALAATPETPPEHPERDARADTPDSDAPATGTETAPNQPEMQAAQEAVSAEMGGEGGEGSEEAESPASPGNGGSSQHRRRRSGRADDTEENGRPAGSAPVPLPHTGKPPLPADPLRIELRVPDFKAATDLPPAAEQADGQDAQPAKPDPRQAQAAYAEAVRFGKSFYQELVGAARDIRAEALREARQAHARLDADLALALQILAGTLSKRLASNDQSRETALARLEASATSLRRRIRHAARVAFGRLTAMKGTYDRETAGPRGKRTSMPGKVSDAMFDNMVARWDAEDEIDSFIETPGSYLSDSDFSDEGRGRWETKAMREAAVEFVVPYARADKTAIGKREDVLYDRLSPLADCLPCQLDTAFMTLDARMDYLMVAGPRSVANARKGAIARVDDLVEQMRITIEEAHSSTARQLVEQHDSTRDMLIEMAKLEQTGAASQIEAGTQRTVEGLTAIAASQTRGIDAAHAELADGAEQPAGIYATSVMAGAAKLKSNIRGMTKAYPEPQREQIRKAEALRGGQRRAAQQQRDKALRDFDDALAASIRQTYDQIDSSIAAEFQRMASVPRQVRSTCDDALARAEEARVNDVNNLTRAVNDLDTRVDATIAGTAARTNNDNNNQRSGDAAETTPAPPSAGADSAGTGERMPPPESCAGCQQEEGETPAQRPAAQGTGDSQAGGNGEGDAPQQTQAPDGTSGQGDNYVSSPDFRRYAGQVKTDPAEGNAVAAFITKVQTQVGKVLTTRQDGCHDALTYSWRKPDVNGLMRSLRGLTPTSGKALEEVYEHGSLRSDINSKFDDMYNWTLSAPSTVRYNRNAALQALNGNVGGAALNELRASINYSNEDSRIREIMQSLTPAQLRNLPDSELDAIAADLDGENLERFNALRRGDGGMERAITLRNDINSANARYGTQRGRDIQEAIAKARTTGGLAIEGDPNRAMADIFGLEHPDVVAGRRDAQWRSTLENFANLRQVQSRLHYQSADTDPTGMAPQLSDEQRRTRYREPFRHDEDFAEGKTNRELENVMLRFAVADRYYGGRRRGPATSRPPPPGYHGESSGIADRPGRLPPDMVNWIEQTIRHGPDSTEERGARLLVEFNRAEARGSAERLDKTIHIGSADAVAGGGYARRDTAAAQEERDRVLVQFARYRAELRGEEPMVGPIDPASVTADLQTRFSTALRNDPHARALALGIIGGEQGDAIAAMEYSIDRGDKAIALRYLRRMDRRQIDAMMAEYDRRHPGGPSLYERLGLFRHHGMGAAFSGDDALELEIAVMGVPQNDRESAEVALRRMDQQIEHSTGAGQSVAADEFSRLQANRDELRRVMGITATDIDGLGRIRLVDDDGNAVQLGNFNADGSFRATPGASMAQFQRAVTLGQITAENFTHAVDEAANFLTTMLAVVAAVVITIATAGAASILLPMLLTAAIGLAGVGMTWALKGGRYSRDDLTRDLANVAVQTLVAGVGAAAGLYMRAGAMGGRAVTTMMGRLSMAEGKLAAQLGMKELAKLTLRQELMLGALTGVVGNVGGAMADPRAWREGRVGDEIWHGMARGAVSGMIGSAAMRPLSRLGQDASLAQQIGARAMLNGVSNSATKAWDLVYDTNRGTYRGSLEDALGEIGTAGATGLIQGGLEAGGERFGQRSGIAGALQNNRTDADRPAAPHAAASSRPDAETPPPPAAELPDTAKTTPPRGMGIDEDGALVPHALMHDDDGPGLRTGDRERPAGRRPLPKPANDNPGGRPHQIAALSDFDMVSMPKAMEGAVFVHPDSTDLMAANDNFGRLINADPSREVAVHFNPVTGEYVVIQGGPNSVAIIRPGGELSGPGAAGRIVSVDGVPDPRGHWIVHSHYHPNRPGETGTALLRRLPSGFAGDFGVIHFESVGLGLGDRRSRIYFSDEGSVAYTDFGVTPGHPEGKYWIDFPSPRTGERVRRRFHTPEEYGSFVKTVRADPDAAISPRQGGLHTADASEPAALRRGSTETALSSADRRSIRDLASAVEGLGEHRRAVDILRENGAAASTIEEARRWIGEAEASTRSMVEAMGLVGEPQSMDRLHHIMNDTAMAPELRQAIGDAVVSATREHLIRSGQLAHDEPLMLLFHGAPMGRARSMAEGGIDLARVGSGHEDDFGAGLYLTSGVANAEKYAAKFGRERGAIFPFMMRRRDMGQVVDVRPGGPHRAQWEAFVSANVDMFAEGIVTPRMAQAMLAGREPAFADLDGFGNRGQVFEAFLAHLSATTGDPALARPDLVLGELGGPFTTGVGHGDQQAARTGVVADVLNSQMGSRAVPASPSGELAHPGALRHDDAEGASLPAEDGDAALPRQVDEDVDRAFAATFDQSIPAETPAQAQQRAAREEARSQATADAIDTAVRQFIAADGPAPAARSRARVLRKIIGAAPQASHAILHALTSGTAEGGGRVLSARQEASLIHELTAGGMPQALAARYAKAFGHIMDAAGPLHQAIATAAERAAWGDSLGGLQQRAESALDRRLLLLAARQFSYREGRESAGPRFKEVFRRDERAVMDFLASTAPMRERLNAFRRARRIAGASPEDVTRDVESLVGALKDAGLQETIDHWQQRYRDAGITAGNLDQIARDHPEVLLMTAHASPDQLAEFMARRITELLPEKAAGNRDIDALEFVASFQRGQQTGKRSLASELEAVRMLCGVPLSEAESAGPAMTLLKSDAVAGGATNRGGLDIVGFQTLPGGADGETILQVVVVDDKAVNAETLDSVSALTDSRLAINLLLAAVEIRRRVAALPSGGTPEMQSFAQDAQIASAQMLAASAELRKLTIPPVTDEAAMQVYHEDVARIMQEHHISQVITSEYGSITRLKEWMTRQGIQTYPEYLRWLARRQRGQ